MSQLKKAVGAANSAAEEDEIDTGMKDTNKIDMISAALEFFLPQKKKKRPRDDEDENEE